MQPKTKRSALSYCNEIIQTAKDMYPDMMTEVIQQVHSRMGDHVEIDWDYIVHK